MNRSDLRHTDLSQLVIFEMLMLERNLTRTAEKMFLGQPAISAALRRLRVYFGDPLFIRTGRKMEPTARAERLFEELRPALDVMSLALSNNAVFNPQSSHATFRIGLSEGVEYGLLPEFLQHLRGIAPNVVIIVRHTDRLRMPDLLANGEISLGVSQTKDLPANAKKRFLRDLRPMVVSALDSAPADTLAAYCQRPHVNVSPNGDINSMIDTDLERLGRGRHVELVISQWSSLSRLLIGTRLLATVPDYVADSLVAQGNIKAEPVPFDVSSIALSLVWRGALDADPAERWLRGELVKCLARP
ncbi:LysR family transcriptional regulator [Pseudomonas sp. dw_358]|uniref:LysR family transcriptional regulator n=1 Tax=Pseudomonas sp. dw_358 TaxID=2720083 RepID=UPI001BD5C7A4|nr:LysR family transcriptional regulator [Pseudomonas sp. dw_358]